MAKKTKNQTYDTWIRNQSERHRQRQREPHYREIIQKLLSVREKLSEEGNQYKEIRSHIPEGIPVSISDPRIAELKLKDAQIETLRKEKASLEKELIDTYGPIDPILEIPSDEELAIFTDFESESDVDPFRDIWVVEPVPCPGKDPFPRGSEGLSEVDWDAYLNDKGFIRFLIKTENPREVIKERLGAWLDILKDNSTITFKRDGKPSTYIVGSLYPQNEIGVVVELNPFAPKAGILKAVIKALEGHGVIFTRRDLLDPKVMRARKLRREGKSYGEIASVVWHDERIRKTRTRKKDLEGEERIRYQQYVASLQENGRSLKQAYKEADKKFGLRGKASKKHTIIKAYRSTKK